MSSVQTRATPRLGGLELLIKVFTAVDYSDRGARVRLRLRYEISEIVERKAKEKSRS